MSRSVPALLTRLRRHRGLWALVVVAWMIKLVTGTLCLSDGPGVRFISSSATTVATASAPVYGDVVAPLNDDADVCVLGEAGGCHCACAHSLTLPAASIGGVAMVHPHFDSPAVRSEFVLAMTGSLLRPPIA